MVGVIRIARTPGAFYLNLLVVVGLSANLFTGARGESVASTSRSLKAARLVQQALDAELAGDSDRRAEFIAAALAADPKYAPARWHNGQIEFQGKWQTVAEIGRQVSGDPRWAEYNERRRALSGSIDEHLELAHWCEEQGLANEARYHWANVLLATPGNKLARERLGLVAYRGGLYADEQVAEQKQQVKQAAKDFDNYKPALVKLCARAVTRAAGHEQALKEIAAIDDPAKLEVLEFAVDRACRKANAGAVERLQRAHVTALASMPDHAATLKLLNYAVLSPSEEIRTRATQALAPRPATDYVPLLMTALSAPYESDVMVFAAPDGTVRLFETIHQEGPEASRTHVKALHLETQGALNHDKVASNPAAVLQGNLARAEAVASDTRESIEAANAEAAERNKRIGKVLKGATGSDPGDDAGKWWRDWQEYNELKYSEHPEYKTYEQQSFVYFYPQARPMYPSGRGPASGTTITRAPAVAVSSTVGLPGAAAVPGAGAGECFAAGTAVWTQSGPRPIESIAEGDLVLAQNPATGELAYRVVLETTVSPPVPVVQLTLPGETITCTRGHRFWVNGRGWAMAKFLEPAMPLHALSGGLEVSAVEVAPRTACHNLVVDEFHTYFVGESKVLVHDRNCPAPNPLGLPGSTRNRQGPTVDRHFAQAVAKSDSATP